jgi:hypothetical protein
VVTAAAVLSQAGAAFATPATAPFAEVEVHESLQPVLHGKSTDAGTGGTHSIHFYARTVGASTWNLLNNVSVAGTDAYQAIPAHQLSIVVPPKSWRVPYAASRLSAVVS